MPRRLAQRTGRDDGGGRRLVEDELALREHAALEQAVAIGDREVQRDRARAGIGRGIDALDASFEGTLAEAVDLELSGLADLHARYLRGRRRRFDLHLGEVDDGEEGCIDGDL